MTFHLQTLLDLRRNAEKDALQALALAMASRRKEEEEQARLVARWRDAGTSMEVESARLASGPDPTTAAQAASREGYLSRLREEVARLKCVAEAHRCHALAAALSSEGAAQSAYQEARKACEAVEKLKERANAEADKQAERRADESAADLAQATHFKRTE
jgi:flagellar biosynthesis chaperone FliJ